MTEHLVERDGDRLAIAAGDEVVIRIPEPATSGYAWSVSELADGIEILSSDVEAGSGIPGAAAERTIRLAARRPSTGRVSLELARPWEAGEPPAERFSVWLEAR